VYRARLEWGEVAIRDEPHASARALGSLRAGDEVSLGDRSLRSDGWMRIERPTPSRGWIQVRATQFRLGRPVYLLDSSAEVRARAEERGEVLLTLTKRARLTLLGLRDAADEEWIRVQVPSGKEGFVPGRTRVKDQDRARWEQVEGDPGGPIEWFLRRGVLGGLCLAGLAGGVLLLDVVQGVQIWSLLGIATLGVVTAVLGIFRGRGGRTDTAWHLAPPRALGG